MKTAKSPTTRATLYNGDRMSQAEFHRRYEAYPDDTKFELIGGVVYMSPPMRGPHGQYTTELGGVFFLYKAATLGVDAPSGITAILGENSEPQPDLQLRLEKEVGGQSEYDEERYLVGAPELVAEVAQSTRAIDMNAKRKDYLGAGVQEYLVFCVEEEAIHWFHFLSKRKLKPSREGIWKSHVFPGLWIDGPALVARDSAKLIATAQKGIDSPEHAEFVGTLVQRRA